MNNADVAAIIGIDLFQKRAGAGLEPGPITSIQLATTFFHWTTSTTPIAPFILHPPATIDFPVWIIPCNHSFIFPPFYRGSIQISLYVGVKGWGWGGGRFSPRWRSFSRVDHRLIQLLLEILSRLSESLGFFKWFLPDSASSASFLCLWTSSTILYRCGGLQGSSRFFGV